MRLYGPLEFAARRRGISDDAIEALLPRVEAALDRYPFDPLWYADLLPVLEGLFEQILADDSGGAVRRDEREWNRLAEQIEAALAKTGEPRDHTARLLATWLSTAIINAAATRAAQADEADLVMVWTTMHDDAVRETHVVADGQAQPIGDTFEVGGEQLRYPGDPTASIELWINCRCMLRPAEMDEELLNAAPGERPSFSSEPDGPSTSLAVMALPAADDPVTDIGEGRKHVTVLYLGDDAVLDRGILAGVVRDVAADIGPFQAVVAGQGNLGDAACVLFVEAPELQRLRDMLLDNDAVRAAYSAVDQFPHFVPHVTVDRDTTPETPVMASIRFDRLAVWDGEQQTEYPVGDASMSPEPSLAVQDLPVGKPDTADQPVDRSEELAMPMPWHGVLAPEGVFSGDGRRFADGALTWRDLPVPLTWQKSSAAGHDGSVVVARIDTIERAGNLMHGSGVFLQTPEADEVVGLIGEFGRFGVSVDADDAEMDLDEETGKVTFTAARIASASVVPIPAFAEAWIALGEWPMDDGETEECDPEADDYEDCVERKRTAAANVFVSDKPWSDFTQADYTDDQWYSACALHKNGSSRAKGDNGLPIKEPGGALNRNGVHAAAARFNQVNAPAAAKAAAKSKIRGAYQQMGEPVPDVLKAAAVTFGRGPGWITDPVETKRIHDYWTKQGEDGYTKIGWGVPGDFNRCRVQVGEEIAEHSPEDLVYLNQICAQWHHDALGIWPGEHHSYTPPDGTPAPAVTLVAAAAKEVPGWWFADPKLSAPTALTVTSDGRVFGHLATWGTCHIGFDGVCVEPPHSASDYAYFLTGLLDTSEGAVSVGQITLGTGHAASKLGARPAAAHYDNTGTAVCDITVGEDDYGIWVAGKIRDTAHANQVETLKASALSGDWRKIRGQMELVAALAVNAPGFPVPRVGVSNAEQTSLVAAGAMATSLTHTPEPSFDTEILAAAFDKALTLQRQRSDAATAEAERRQRAEKMAALRKKVNG